MMRAAGLGLGGTLDNALVIDDFRVLNSDGLRFDDEFVRTRRSTPSATCICSASR